MAANGEAISSLLLRVYRAMTEEMTPASNVEEEMSRVFLPRVGEGSFAQSRLNQNRTEQICLFGVLYKDSTSTISK